MILATFFFGQLALADVTFEKADLKIGNKTVHAQIADDDEHREHGLMFVKHLGPDEGMLFVFDNEHVLNFWMKNTVIPLSIGFFDQQGLLIDTQEMESTSLMENNPKTYTSNGAALLALEMPKGWFLKNRIEKGAQISFAHPPKSALLKQKLQSLARQTSSGHGKSGNPHK